MTRGTPLLYSRCSSSDAASDVEGTYADLGVSRILEKPINMGALLGAIEAIQTDLQIEKANGGGLN